VPVFPGEDEADQLACMMEVLGVPQKGLIEMAPRGHLFFDNEGIPMNLKNSRGKVRKPGSKHLSYALRCRDETFVDFLIGCFQWNAEDRMNPDTALKHPFILEGLPDNIKKIFKEETNAKNSSPTFEHQNQSQN